jgi:uncharacterized membrane protein
MSAGFATVNFIKDKLFKTDWFHHQSLILQYDYLDYKNKGSNQMGTMIDKFMRAPQGNTLAVLVFIALIISWIISLILGLSSHPISTDKGWYAKLPPIFALLGIPATLDLIQTTGITFLFAAIVFVVLVLNIIIPILKNTGKFSYSVIKDWYKWSFPVLVIGGLAVTSYLTFIEATHAPIMCGPTGGCPDVQNSPYSKLFGFLPVGMLGLVGYIAILASWLAWQFGPQAIQNKAALFIWAMCIFGVLFSTYLTFLEPFVIGATCMWCISSAVIMIILLLVSNPAAQQAFIITDDEELLPENE